ncbi:F-box protein At1g49990-like [Brassica napus]|uniref:(rape) hypothetical protein n=1 Tax=Brassica napus TaxID=3708 RepID=A0A816ITS4_BRANA|nr:F-box protein At1g49990-like [Brassica napus]CAF1725350.1 unnamed protein product [Brassica napus]
MKRPLTESGEDNPNPSKKLSKISMEKRRKRIPAEILMEILARLPMKAIARFKSVSKKWNSETESPYFIRRYFSLHPNSSTWSLMFLTKLYHPITEAIGFHGRDTWDLPKSLASYVLPFQPYPNLPTVNNYYYVASSNGLIWIEVYLTHHNRRSFVGNPVSKQWVEIPQPPNKCAATGLVTRVENGLVTSFKVVRTCSNQTRNVWRVYVYSSETGLWSFKRLLSFCPVDGANPPVNIDGKLYLWEKDSREEDLMENFIPKEFGFLVGYDFYGDDNQCQVVPLPIPDNKYVRRCLTTSRGDVMYVEILYRRLKVWRLSSNNLEGSELLWELSREEINLASIGFDVFCFPLAMNPFDDDIIYLWSREHDCVVTGNLQTLEFVLHQESENWSSASNGGCCRFNKLDSKRYMDGFRNETSTSVVILSQFVLPPWMDLVPRPPHILV